MTETDMQQVLVLNCYLIVTTAYQCKKKIVMIEKTHYIIQIIMKIKIKTFFSARCFCVLKRPSYMENI